MNQRYVLTLVLATLVVLGTTIGVVTSNSKGAKKAATYVGQETCMSSGCHADDEGSTYSGAAEFHKTMHYKIHHRPNPENMTIERWFQEGRTLSYYESKVRQSPGDTLYIDLSKGATETDYLIQLRTEGPHADSTGWMKVAYNYGGNGWLHRFLIEIDGSYYTAPFQYVLPHYRETSTDTGDVVYLDLTRWYNVDNSIDAIVFYDWKSDDFLKQSWDKRCASCHVNGFDVTSKEIQPEGSTQWNAQWVGTESGDSATKDINIAIGCESCHGPGSEHAADPENRDYLDDIDPGRWDRFDTSRYWTDRKLDVCNQCHNRHASTEGIHTYPYDDANNLPYLPGLELNDFIADPITGANYWDDLKTSKAHHQTGQDYWRSGHYTGHVFTNGCVDCHEAHKDTEYPYQLNRNWYSLTQGEGCLATGCHIDKGVTEMRDNMLYNTHTKHLQENSQCVNCHYTKTATITFNGTYEFSDHSDKVIRPTATLDHATGGLVGMPNTCAVSCHRNGYGERNRPDAFDEHVAVKWSTGGKPTVAPDFGIRDNFIDIWKENSDLRLADTLWALYQEMYKEYVTSVRTGAAHSKQGAITSVSPNPARDVVRVEFTLPRTENIQLEVYNSRGQRIRVIAQAKHEAGTYQDMWEGINEANQSVPSGTYFIRLTGETFSSTQAVMVSR